MTSPSKAPPRRPELSNAQRSQSQCVYLPSSTCSSPILPVHRLEDYDPSTDTYLHHAVLCTPCARTNPLIKNSVSTAGHVNNDFRFPPIPRPAQFAQHSLLASKIHPASEPRPASMIQHFRQITTHGVLHQPRSHLPSMALPRGFTMVMRLRPAARHAPAGCLESTVWKLRSST